MMNCQRDEIMEDWKELHCSFYLLFTPTFYGNLAGCISTLEKWCEARTNRLQHM